MIGDAAAVLHGLSGVASSTFVGWLSVGGLHVAAPLMLVMHLMVVGFLEFHIARLRRRLKPRRCPPGRGQIRHERVVPGRRSIRHTWTRRDAIDADQVLVIQERL